MREIKSQLISVLNPDTGKHEDILALRGRDGGCAEAVPDY